ncbi:MAG TPA: HlyD family type I secretion periplasmic adaptor subunit [Allosphingosinicella sp.]|nr:HlyD family type I secretion periplasmic adaptor subunit [Allosphingosinicella sp.]
MNAISRHWDIVRSALEEERARAKALAKVEETAFLPAALEIIERPVSPTGRWTARALLLLLVLTILWLTLGKIDVVASAPGRLIPAENVKLVQPAGPGVVRAILVHDGQKVRKGQALVELDPTVSTAEVQQARKALESAALDLARARAILSGLDGKGLVFIAPEGTPVDIAATQRALAASQLAQIEASAAGHSNDRRAAEAARGEALLTAAKLTETLPLLDEQIDANEKMLAKGYVAKLKVIEMRRQRMATARDRDIALQTARRAEAQLAGAGSGEAEGRAGARAQILSDLAKAEADAKLKREELVKASQRSTLQRLVAPVDGTVAQLAVHTIGGVVEATKPIMVIVPTGGSLVVEAKLLNRDAGFVAVGQEAAVKLEAFPFTRYGTVPGRIESVSSDAIEDEKLGLVYTARVRLERDTINRGDSIVQLTPGLAATADAKTGKRSIISYLISPIKRARLEAGRER